MSLKQKIQQKQKTLGTWITVYHRAFVEMVCDLGYDWICIDIEHSSIDLDQLATLISIGRGRGVDVLVRLSELNSTLIKRVMDSGASGLIVPMVNSQEHADLAYQSMHYPPVGFRGVGLATAQKYGGSFEEYKKWLARESVLIVQIEHKDAVKNIDAILAHPGVDGFIVGPYDLSASYGKPGDFKCTEFLNAMKTIESAQGRISKARGIHIVEPKTELVTDAVDKGYNFIAYSFETRLFEVGMREAKKVFSKTI